LRQTPTPEEIAGADAPAKPLAAPAVDARFVQGLAAGKQTSGASRLAASEWEKVLKRYETVRDRMSPDEKRVADEYYRMLRDIR
jgi:hypothetical protein